MSSKLFVGQVPKTYESEHLDPIVRPFGNVTEIKIIKDKDTGAHKGCAFVTFETKEEADACILGLHNQIQLEGASHPLQVKPSQSTGGGGGGGGGGSSSSGQLGLEDESSHKIFVGQLGPATNEQDLTAIFSALGTIEEVTILRGSNGISKLCGFVRFSTRDAAIQAIATMNGKHQWPGAKEGMTVRFADSDKFKQMRKMQLQSKQLADQANAILMNPLIAQIMQNPMAAAQFGLTGMGGYMGQPGAQQYNYGGAGGAQGGANAGYGGYGASTGAALYGNMGGYGMPQSTGSAPGHSTQKEGPPGANLFIYHLPNEYVDAHLVQLFSPYGNLLSAKVFVDKATQTSKCFGFVSYDNQESAMNAISALNGLQLGSKRLKVSVKSGKALGTGNPY